MNLFYLSRDAKSAAQGHCDKHVVKMIVEYAQLLSTAHRLLDGEMSIEKSKTGRNVKRWKLAESDEVFYVASHVNHPAATWCRASSANYKFLYELFIQLCGEYTHRYGKVHATQTKCGLPLSNLPKNIHHGEFVDPPLTMPDEFKVDDAVISYQNLYVVSKARFAKWTNRQPPEWFIQRTPDYDEANFTRTRSMVARKTDRTE
jgi:hypothetical protein